jgi:hypothetical protein
MKSLLTLALFIALAGSHLATASCDAETSRSEQLFLKNHIDSTNFYEEGDQNELDQLKKNELWIRFLNGASKADESMMVFIGSGALVDYFAALGVGAEGIESVGWIAKSPKLYSFGKKSVASAVSMAAGLLGKKEDPLTKIITSVKQLVGKLNEALAEFGMSALTAAERLRLHELSYGDFFVARSEISQLVEEETNRITPNWNPLNTGNDDESYLKMKLVEAQGYILLDRMIDTYLKNAQIVSFQDDAKTCSSN